MLYLKNKLNYIFKVAENEKEFELIHRLNYKTFVEEIPQHHENESGYLVDKFHNKNTYIISLDGDKLAGMISVNGERPFSLDYKVPNLDCYLPEGANICEIRLLAVEKEYRSGFVFYGLAKKLIDYCKEKNYNYAIISGTTRQLKLYKHIGFTPFYSLVGKENAFYQPMYLDIKMFEEGIGKIIEKKS